MGRDTCSLAKWGGGGLEIDKVHLASSESQLFIAHYRTTQQLESSRLSIVFHTTHPCIPLKRRVTIFIPFLPFIKDITLTCGLLPVWLFWLFLVDCLCLSILSLLFDNTSHKVCRIACHQPNLPTSKTPFTSAFEQRSDPTATSFDQHLTFFCVV